MKGCHAYSAVDRPCYAWESDDGDGGAKQWGRNDKQDPGAIIDIHKIEVMVSEDNAGLAQAIPQRVKLKIDYYQIDVTDKKLVRAEISMLEKCTTVPPEEFGGNPTVISNMLDMDIDTCPVTWNGILKSQAYVLDVRFQGLDWCVPLRPRLLARAHARARARGTVSRVGVSRVGVSRVGVSLVGVSHVGVSRVGVSLVGVSRGNTRPPPAHRSASRGTCTNPISLIRARFPPTPNPLIVPIWS